MLVTNALLVKSLAVEIIYVELVDYLVTVGHDLCLYLLLDCLTIK